jgi:hypothetical protein
VFVALMLGGSLLWLLLVAAALLPGLGTFLRTSTPFVANADVAIVRFAVILSIVALPILIGLAGYLAPASDERARGLAAIVQILRGYPLAIVMGAMLLFLPAIGIDRKVRSLRRGWSDIHVPIVVKPGGYERMVADLEAALQAADLPVTVSEAPGILTVPGRTLSLIADGSVRGLVPDRLVELTAPELEIGIYPSDIAISGRDEERLKARAVIVSRLATSSAHFTTSSESQALEDRLAHVARRGGAVDGELDDIDAELLTIDVAAEDWDILYRLRLQVERDALRG